MRNIARCCSVKDEEKDDNPVHVSLYVIHNCVINNHINCTIDCTWRKFFKSNDKNEGKGVTEWLEHENSRCSFQLRNELLQIVMMHHNRSAARQPLFEIFTLEQSRKSARIE